MVDFVQRFIEVFHRTLCYLKTSRFQMADFVQRFNEVSNDIVHLSDLDVNKKYPIARVDRMTTKFGETILVSIRDPDRADQPIYKVFLPQRYAATFTDEDVQALSGGERVCYLLYNGRCPKTNAYQVSVE